MNADKKLIISIICILIFLVAWIKFPDIIKCPYKTLTGSPCLFCGTLTSLSFVLHGRIEEALRANPIGLFVFFGLAIVCIRCIIKT